MVVGGSVVVGGGAPLVVVVGGSVVVGGRPPLVVVLGAVEPGAPGTEVVTGNPANPPPGGSATEVDGPGVNEPPPPRGAGRLGIVNPPSEVVVTATIDVVVEEGTALPRSDSEVDVVTRRAASTSAASVTRRARASLAASSARADEAKPPIMAT